MAVRERTVDVPVRTGSASKGLLHRCAGVPCPSGGCRHDEEPAHLPQPLRFRDDVVQTVAEPPTTSRHGHELGHIRIHRDATVLESAAAGPTPSTNAVPPIVREVLRSPGLPLDLATRAFFEPRLGRDFSDVLVHTDARAAESARAVNALAYTVGRNVVFGAGRYAPHLGEGRKLMAHELTHVTQEGGHGGSRPTAISSPDSPAERDAARAAETMAARRSFLAGSPAEVSAMLHRQPAPASTAAPDAGQAQSPAPVVWHMVSASDITHIASLLKTPVLYGPGTGGATPRFVIHDTGVTVNEAWIRRQVAEAHAQHGEGAAAYVPRSGPPSIARPSIFDPRRPATTQFERVNDLMDKKTREATYRAVWQNSSAAVQTAALEAAVRNGLSPTEQTQETAIARNELNAGSGEVHTTGAWAATEICQIVQTQGALAAANSPTAVFSFQAACIRLAPVIEARRERIGSTMNVETAQETGSTTPGKGPALPRPAYNDTQYEDLALLYLRAALQAYRWPHITTHFVVDRGTGDHIDPRCFDIGKLYRTIATLMGHRQNTSYGIAPSYGTSATSAVWWDKVVCGGPPP
jgi:hypothetical protein